MTTRPELVRELELLRRSAARGTGRATVGLDELAKRLTLPRSTLHTYLSGRTLPPSDVLDRLVIELGASDVEQREWAEAWFRVCGVTDDAMIPAPRAPHGEPAPAQLPADLPGLVGRDAELAALDEAFSTRTETPPLVALEGMAGVGKTALAVHWAHRIRRRFPDGQLFVDLRGYAPSPPATLAESLGRLLQGLGLVTDQLPGDEQASSALLRSALDGRRVLLVLDNVRDPEQVRPLLPGSPSCATLVTGRGRLSGLAVRDGAVPITVDRLPSRDSQALLGRLLGADVVRSAARAADELVAHCNGLPLALSIIGNRAARHATLDELAATLRDERSVIPAFADTDDPWSDLWTVMSWSYRALPADAAALFRTLGRHHGGDITVRATAQASGLPVDDTRRLLQLLTDRHLLIARSGDRYALPGLLHAYAADQSTATLSE